MKIALIVLSVCLGGLFFLQEAEAGENPGSLLLFPYFNTAPHNMSVVSISNVSPDPVWVRLVWIESFAGFPRDMWIDLAGFDSFTFIDDALFFSDTDGFFYFYVVEEEYSTHEIQKDILVGQELIISRWDDRPACFSMNALTFKALDLTPDGELYLDGVEFEAAPKSLYFPRFFRKR